MMKKRKWKLWKVAFRTSMFYFSFLLLVLFESEFIYDWKIKFHCNIVSQKLYGKLNSTEFVENVQILWKTGFHCSVW